LVEMIAAPTLGAGNKERVQSLSRAHRKRCRSPRKKTGRTEGGEAYAMVGAPASQGFRGRSFGDLPDRRMPGPIL